MNPEELKLHRPLIRLGASDVWLQIVKWWPTTPPIPNELIEVQFDLFSGRESPYNEPHLVASLIEA